MSKKVQIDQLGNAERLKKLSIVDKLREHGVGVDISYHRYKSNFR